MKYEEGSSPREWERSQKRQSASGKQIKTNSTTNHTNRTTRRLHKEKYTLKIARAALVVRCFDSLCILLKSRKNNPWQRVAFEMCFMWFTDWDSIGKPMLSGRGWQKLDLYRQALDKQKWLETQQKTPLLQIQTVTKPNPSRGLRDPLQKNHHHHQKKQNSKISSNVFWYLAQDCGLGFVHSKSDNQPSTTRLCTRTAPILQLWLLLIKFNPRKGACWARNTPVRTSSV